MPHGIDFDQGFPFFSQFDLSQFRLGLHLAGTFGVQIDDVRRTQVLGGVGDHITQQVELAAAFYLHRINAGQDVPHLPVIKTKFGGQSCCRVPISSFGHQTLHQKIRD